MWLNKSLHIHIVLILLTPFVPFAILCRVVWYIFLVLLKKMTALRHARRRRKFPKEKPQFEGCIIEPCFRSFVMKTTTYTETLISTRSYGFTSQKKKKHCGFCLTSLFTHVCKLLYYVLLIKLSKFACDLSQYLITSWDSTRCSNERRLTVSLLHNCAFVLQSVQKCSKSGLLCFLDFVLDKVQKLK